MALVHGCFQNELDNSLYTRLSPENCQSTTSSLMVNEFMIITQQISHKILSADFEEYVMSQKRCFFASQKKRVEGEKQKAAPQ